VVKLINDRTYLLRKNQALFLACLGEFTKNSFDQASINEIIKNSGLNKGSFYYRFKTKEDVYFALIDYVYTIQISLFNEENIDFSSISSIKQALYLLYENINKLSILNSDYYVLLQRIFKENVELQNKIKKNCIEPILVRFNVKIKSIIEKQNLNINQRLFFHNLILNYYYFPFNLNELLSKDKIYSVIRIVLNSLNEEDIKPNKHNDLFILPEFQDKLVYLLSNKNGYYKENTIFLGQYLIDEKEFLHNVRENLKIRKVDLNSIITEGIKRNLKDYSYLLVLKNLNFSIKSFHLLNQIEKYFLALVFLNVIGTERIVLNNLLKFADLKDIHLLFTELLPLLSKTCKIVVIEPEFPLFLDVIDNLYYQKNNDVIKAVSQELLPKNNNLYYLIKYKNKKGYLISKKIKKVDFNINNFLDLSNFTLINFGTIHIDQIKN